MSVSQHEKYVRLRGELKLGNLMKFSRILSNITVDRDEYPLLDTDFLPISYRARKELKNELKMRLNWQYYIEKENLTRETKIDQLYEIITGDDLDDAIYNEIERELNCIERDTDRSRTDIYNLFKSIRRNEGYGIIMDLNNTLSDIKKNGWKYRNVSLPLTLAMDKDFNTWNEQTFKREFSNKFNIPLNHIDIVSVKSGSTIIDMKINTKSRNNIDDYFQIECIAENISQQQAKKAFTEFKTFALEFGPLSPGFTPLKQRVIMNPRWNREYGPGYTHWDGALNDGNSRGGEPYYCPNGWKRFSVQFEETPYDFDNVYNKWPIAYHGTKFDSSLMICLSGLKAFDGCHGIGVYLSPSIEYCAHPRYAEPIQLDLSTEKQKWTQQHQDLLTKYDGKWIQCVFACRVKPDCYQKKEETMGLGSNGKFDNIDLNMIEWIVKGKEGQIIGADKILIYGIMIKASDSYPEGY